MSNCMSQMFYTNSRSVPVLLLNENLMRPELSKSDTTKYHLFLSHIWRSGQDQVAVIKRQLQLCLPGVSIFLDVDDLLDVSALESYIEKSAVVLIFLSKGYFFSKNCLREVRCSEQNDKPLVLVNEADLSKGGIALKDSRAECPEDLRSFVFDDRAVIQYGAESQTQSNLCY